LLYATGQILADPTTDQTLAFAKTIVQDHPNDLARLVGDMLWAKKAADQNTTAKMPPTSTLWDEFIDVTIQVSDEPGLLEDVIRAFGDDATLPLAGAFASEMANKDHFSYDRTNLNGPPVNYGADWASPPTATPTATPAHTPVDRTKRDTGDNRSQFQKFVQVLADTNGVTVCNKDGAVLHGRGLQFLPIPGLSMIIPPANVDAPAGPANAANPIPLKWFIPPLLKSHYGTKTSWAPCELLKIENVATFYLDAILGLASIYTRDTFAREGIDINLPNVPFLGNVQIQLGEATVGEFEASSLVGYSSDTNAPDMFNCGLQPGELPTAAEAAICLSKDRFLGHDGH
jgi:hypothetical protein